METSDTDSNFTDLEVISTRKTGYFLRSSKVIKPKYKNLYIGIATRKNVVKKLHFLIPEDEFPFVSNSAIICDSPRKFQSDLEHLKDQVVYFHL